MVIVVSVALENNPTAFRIKSAAEIIMRILVKNVLEVALEVPPLRIVMVTAVGMQMHPHAKTLMPVEIALQTFITITVCLLPLVKLALQEWPQKLVSLRALRLAALVNN